MNKDSLIVKRDAIKSEFEEQEKIKTNAEVRQRQLQGAHTLIEELIEFLEQLEKDEEDTPGENTTEGEIV
jgi:hypothetical protein